MISPRYAGHIICHLTADAPRKLRPRNEQVPREQDRFRRPEPPALLLAKQRSTPTYSPTNERPPSHFCVALSIYRGY